MVCFKRPDRSFRKLGGSKSLGRRGYREERVLRNGTVVGLLPSDPGGRFGIIWGGARHWSHLCGPLIAPGLSPEAKREVIRQLVRKLRRGISHCYTMNYDYPDADLVRAEFERANFDLNVTTTFIQLPADPDVMVRLEQQGRKRGRDRTSIRSAERHLTVESISADTFISFYESNLKAAGKKSHSPLDVARQLIVRGTSLKPPRVIVWGARAKSSVSGKNDGTALDGAIAFALDDATMYAWMITTRRGGHQGAGRLLLVHAMRFAQRKGLIFDADGLAVANQHKLYGTHLALREAVRYQFVRKSLTLKMLEQNRGWLRPIAQAMGRVLLRGAATVSSLMLAVSYPASEVLSDPEPLIVAERSEVQDCRYARRPICRRADGPTLWQSSEKPLHWRVYVPA
jgi:hypothetical protein